MPTSSIHFTPSRRKKSGIASMKKISETCPYDNRNSRVLEPNLADVDLCIGVVGGEWDADEERNR